MEDLEQSGLDAVDRFLTTWNSRDPENWATSLNFPHVRPSPFGEINVADTAEDYVVGVDYGQLIKSGWDHSEWDYKHVLHTSPSKIHVAGQWSRYSAAGDIILTTPIVYVCTKVNGEWGIQSRLAVDYVDEDADEDTPELIIRSMNLIQDFIGHYSTGARDACAELLNFPHFSIGTGKLNMTAEPEDFEILQVALITESAVAIQTGLHAMNVAVELSIAGDSINRRTQGVINVNDRDGHLGIQAWSFLYPDEQPLSPNSRGRKSSMTP
ncbi:MAG: hypothetical protein ACNYPE_11580 [Candidatus Azotimanducaceae bacterium WSBS_2022_MAG_OTU7]